MKGALRTVYRPQPHSDGGHCGNANIQNAAVPRVRNLKRIQSFRAEAAAETTRGQCDTSEFYN